MSFQFFHVSTYARQTPKKRAKGKDRKWTVRDIAGEAERDPKHSPHVAKPLEPNVVFGMKVRDAVTESERRAESSTDVSGRKVRKDTPVMLSGVASHPLTVTEMDDPKAKAAYEEWKRDTVIFLKKKYGGNLLSIVEHLDEKHPHLHFYAVPDVGKGFNAKILHDGFKASSSAKDPAEQQRLYCAGMRALQDNYFVEVGAKHAQARLGPKRQRLSRAEWLQEQTHLAQISKLMRAGKVTLAKANRQAGLIMQQAKADSQRLGLRFGAFFSGVAGKARDALRQLEHERDEERRKLKFESDRRKKAEEQAETIRVQLVRERLTADKRVENLVAIKTGSVVSQLDTVRPRINKSEPKIKVPTTGGTSLRL